MKKLLQENSLLWLALTLALLGSLTHVAWSFSTLENGNMLLGYVQAIAVDVGLFAIAVGIARARREDRSTWRLWGGVLFFAFISTYANLLHGLAFSSDLRLSDNAQWLVALRPLLLSAVLPILVVYLAEVAAGRMGRSTEGSYDYPKAGELPGLTVPLAMLGTVFLDNWLLTHHSEPWPPEMPPAFERATGIEIDTDQADQLIKYWRKERGRSGARKTTPTPGVVVEGNGRPSST